MFAAKLLSGSLPVGRLLLGNVGGGGVTTLSGRTLSVVSQPHGPTNIHSPKTRHGGSAEALGCIDIYKGFSRCVVLWSLSVVIVAGDIYTCVYLFG